MEKRTETDMIHLPEAFCERMRGLLGDQYGEFIASYDRDRVLSLIHI